MNDINLMESIDKGGYREKKFSSGSSIALPVFVLIAIFSLLICGKLFLAYLSSKNQKVMKENEQEMVNLNGKNVDRIVNFDIRMETGLKELNAKDNYENYLKELESLIVSGARIDSLKYSADAVELAVSADNFNTVARQMLSFKGSNYFKSLKIGKTSGSEDGMVHFTMKK